MADMAPGLYLVATPIGNLGDITARAARLLAGCDLIACEDTRVSAKLLQSLSVTTPTLAYHDHNAARQRPKLMAKLAQGARIALISDAGTPLIADPGYKLVQDCYDQGIAVTALPGPSAVTTALMLSGLPTDRYFFGGFLPQKPGKRSAMLDELGGLAASLVFFESPQRLPTSLADLAKHWGDRPAAVARELTKRFEEVRRGSLSALADHYAQAGPPKGEIVLVIGPAPLVQTSDQDLDALLKQALATQSVKEAVAQVAQVTGLPKRTVYQRALALKDQQ